MVCLTLNSPKTRESPRQTPLIREARTRSDAFGKVTGDSATAIVALFRFTARPYDEDGELQNNLNRWYDLSTGRWLSTDPIGFEAGDMNLYAYSSQNPPASLDPTGEFSTSIISPNEASIILAHRLGLPAPFAVRINAALMGIFLASSLFDIPTSAGLGGVLVFFPDTCEIGAFTLTRGIVTTGTQFDVSAEFGMGVGFGLSIEGATQLSWGTVPWWHRGNASAASFVGVFRTIELGFGPSGSVYAGVADDGEFGNVRVNWVGSTLGMPGLGFTAIADFSQWDYKLIDEAWQLSDCACEFVIKKVF